ncbi:MAG: NADPH-dependent 7-cyano-7-deazaguanine reductase QueF [Myxococcota bacterium]
MVQDQETPSVLHASPLGKRIDQSSKACDADVLFAVPREQQRAQLGLAGKLPFWGEDVWNAFELSWLDPVGKPIVALAELRFPHDSSFLVESKSLKLYLNSFYNARFDSSRAVAQAIARDLAKVCGATVKVRLVLAGRAARDTSFGRCIDGLPVACAHYMPCPSLLRTLPEQAREVLCSHLLRSRCPVTNQPDWGSVRVDYEGPRIDPAGLLQYVVSFRDHQGFHEQCVEHMFLDISRHCKPSFLLVQARYTRRGGLDINPYRTTDPTRPAPANSRLFRQ